MKICVAVLLIVTACASHGARRGAVVPESALPEGLRAGPHEVALNGVRHFYRVGGRADTTVPPVVFLHGGPGQGSEHFDALAGPAMERELRMVYFDQRGSGKSERPARGDTMTSDGKRRSDCDLEFRALRGADRDRYNTELMFPDPAVEKRMDSVNAALGIRNTGELSRAQFAAGLLQYRFAAFDRLTMPVLIISG